MALSNTVIDAYVLTKSDSAENKYKALRNGDAAAGSIRVRFRVTGKDFIFMNVPTGGIVYADVDRVYALNTSVTRVEGLTIE